MDVGPGRISDGSGLVVGEDVGGDALEEEKHALHKNIPQHAGDQRASEIPEDLWRERELAS